MNEQDTAILEMLSNERKVQLLELQAHYDARCRAPGDTKPYSLVEVVSTLIAQEHGRLVGPVEHDRRHWRHYGSTAADLQMLGHEP